MTLFLCVYLYHFWESEGKKIELAELRRRKRRGERMMMKSGDRRERVAQT